jgi:hypothetical protein
LFLVVDKKITKSICCIYCFHLIEFNLNIYANRKMESERKNIENLFVTDKLIAL